MTEEETIRVLAVRQPWASLIVEGLKTIEVRSRNTNMTGKVAIYASKNIYTEAEGNAFLDMIYRMEDAKTITTEKRGLIENTLYDNVRGKIIGTVVIYDSTKPVNTLEYEIFQDAHFAPNSYYETNKTYFWHLADPVKFPEPIPLDKWPSGGPWARIPKSMLQGV